MWDFSYKNSAPADVAVPTIDGTATDPDAATLANAGIGSFEVSDLFHLSTGSPIDLVIFSVGGSPILQIYVYAKSAGWVLLHDNVVPTPTVPARRQLPPYSKCYIRVQTKGTTTAIYAGYDVG